jgi:hypothetical protein
MLLKIGYLLRGVSSTIIEKIAAVFVFFADSESYRVDNTDMMADNDSSIT